MYTSSLADVFRKTGDDLFFVKYSKATQHFNIKIHFSTTYHFLVFQDTRENLYDHSFSNSGHYGSVQYLSGLLELPYTGHLQVL